MQNNASYKAIALWIIRISLFIVPFIPLYVAKSLFFPYITGKAFIFRFLVELSFAAWIFLAIYHKEYRPKKTLLLYAVAAFVAVVTLATIFGVNPMRSFWSNFERMEGLIAHLHLFAYFLVLGHVFKKWEWLVFLNLFVGAGLIEDGYAFLQQRGVLQSLQGGANRADGTIGNPSYLAAYLLFVFAFAVMLFVQIKQKAAKYWYGVVGAATLLAIYFTASRGPTLGLFVACVAAAVLYLIFGSAKNDQEKKRKKIALVCLIALVLVAGGLWKLKETSFIKGNPVLSRLTSLSFTDRTITSRFTIWKMGFEGFRERPVVGWGPENYPVIFSKYFKPELWLQEPWFDRSHNIVFDWLINAGLFGLLAYAGLFVAALVMMWRRRPADAASTGEDRPIDRKTAVVLSSLFLAYLFQNLFIFDQIATYIGFFAVLAYIQSRSGNVHASASATEKRPPAAPPLAVAGILFVLFVGATYAVVYKPFDANLRLLEAMQFTNAQNFPAAFEKYGQAFARRTLGTQETREQFSQFALIVIGSPGDQAFKQKVFERAIEELKKGTAENQLDPRPFLFLGAVYRAGGFPDEAIRAFEQAIALSPKKQQIYFELADIYMRRGDYAGAIKLLDQAFRFDPRFPSARLNLAAAYILNDEQEKADALLTEWHHTVNIPDRVLAQVYSIKKNYPRLLGILKTFVDAEPENVAYREDVARAYLLMGKKEDAIKSLEEAILAIPSFREQGERDIADIKSGKIQ